LLFRFNGQIRFYLHEIPRVALGGVGFDGRSGQGSLPFECGRQEPQYGAVTESVHCGIVIESAGQP